MNILTIRGNNLDHDELSELGFEYDPDRRQYQAYIVPGSEDEFVEISGRYQKLGARVDVIDQAQWERQGLSFEQREPEVCEFLRSYTGNFQFLQSLKQQLASKGYLTDGQLAGVLKCMKCQEEGVVRPQPQQPVANPTYAPGSVLELSGFIAKKIGEKTGYHTQHRNVEVIETLRETERAVLVRAKLSSRFAGRCVCCGRRLTNTISKASGIGPECADKYGVERYEMGAAKDIVAQVEARLPKEPVEIWIPRSQVVGVLDKEGDL
jgi:hypothetical protein